MIVQPCVVFLVVGDCLCLSGDIALYRCFAFGKWWSRCKSSMFMSTVKCHTPGKEERLGKVKQHPILQLLELR